MTSPRRIVLAPTVLLFGIMVAHAILETARDALFLARLGSQHLAAAYLAIAALALVVMTMLRRVRNTTAPRQVLIAALVLAAAGTALLAAVVQVVPSAVFVLYVWTGLVATVVVPSFWTTIDRSLRVSEAKRAFAMIGAGGVLGAIVGSAIAGGLGGITGARALVPIAAIVFTSAALAASRLAPVADAEEPPLRRGNEQVTQRSRRYLRILVAIGLVSTIALTIADLTFKRVIAERVAASDLVTVFGSFYAVLNLLGLLIQLIVTPRLLTRFGVANALTVLPVLLVATASGFALTGALLSVLLLKLSDGGLRHSLHRVATELLFLPMPATLRDRAKPIVDAVSQRGGQALAALLWLALAGAAVSVKALGIVVAALAMLWLVAIRFGQRAYIAQFRDMLRVGQIERDVRVPDLDSHSIAVLEEVLSSPDEYEALTALELLARAGRVSSLVLYHPSPMVVRRALTLLPLERRPDAARVLHHLITHSDPTVRAAALIAASRSGTAAAELEAAAADPDAEIRAAALVGLILTRKGDLDDPHAAQVAAMVNGSTAERLALARAIAYAPHERFRGSLYEMLAFREPPVMREVLRLFAAAPHLVELDRVLPLLEAAHVRGDARRVLLAVGSASLDALIAALEDPRTSAALRRHLPRTVSRFRTQAAVNALVARLLREPDRITEFKILRALGRLRVDDPALRVDQDVVRTYMRRAFKDAVRYTTFRDRLAHADVTAGGADLLRELVLEKRRWAIEHVFRSLGILHPRSDVRSAYDAIVGRNDARRAAAREILDSVVPVDIRATLYAILDEANPDRLEVDAGEPGMTLEALYAALLVDPSESLKCVVAHHIAERHLTTMRRELELLRPAVAAPLVIYAFDQAIARLHA